MGVVKLDIYRTANGSETLVAKANKWKFQDTVMGEQFITCTITSQTPVDWEIGDHCEFRGEIFTLNYIPSVTQKAPIGSVQDAFTYENVKLDSFQDELTRCMMLDVTPTTPEYVAVLGTNHTGSSRFQLYCGETIVNGSTLTAVCALALKMQANLDRLYPNAWHIYVDTTTTYVTPSGETVLTTHTDSKLLTFDNQTVSQALGLVHTEFKLDFCIKGRNIYIGYSVDSIDPLNPITDLTGDDANETFLFGYGKGYVDADNQGKSLFQIKQIANSQQKIVTRLRALGSTKNLPYNYYFKKYDLLSQALFPNNLQLPGTFLPLGQPSDTADADGETKWAQNNARSQYLRKVLGDTNDSYIDKNDNAEACIEGIREDCARWDGSDGELPEIYPTIEGVTFGELRNAGVPDQTGATGTNAYQGDSVQPDYERIDCLLAVGYTDGGVLIDDANIGDGIMPEDEVVDTGTHFAIGIGQTKLSYNAQSGNGDFDDSSLYLEGEERVLFTVKDVSAGNYFMVPTGPSYSCVAYRFSIGAQSSASASVGFIIRVKQKVGNAYTPIATWYSDFVTASNSTGEQEMYLPELPDQATSGQVASLTVTALCDVVVTFAPIIESVNASGQITLTYQVGKSQSGEYDPEYTWASVQGDVASKYPFHVFIKDMGFDLTATFNGETPVMAMKSGGCVGREFQIGENVQKATVNGIRGYLLTLNRVEDSNLHTYYPNENYRLSAGDYFVLLNINMPDAYIRAAELRLLNAATEYLADNCDTKYTYQPSIDDIYLQRNYDAMVKAGTPEKSIFWRLYAGLKFKFNGIPTSAGGPLPLVSMTIEQVSITMGDSLTPKVELTLNDDVQQTTLQKLTIAVDRIYNGSIFGSGGVGTNMEAVVDIASRLFLSKTHNDEANGRITFNDIATFSRLLKANGGIDIGTYLSGFLGSGAHIGEDGRSEFEEVSVRGALHAAELVFNQISAEEGESIRSIGHGEIESVTKYGIAGNATLKLEGDEWATIEVGDICRGLYNTVEKDFDNSDSTGEDANGFRNKRGFFASYFVITGVTSAKGSCSFTYRLQAVGFTAVCEHPCPLMKFAVYGNNDNNKKDRQSSIYTTAVGIAPRQLYLAGVNDWKIKPENIKLALGNIGGLRVWQEVTQSEYNDFDGTDGVDKKTSTEIVDGETVTHYIVLKPLVGDAGFYCEDNIYLGGIIEQFKSAAMDAINSQVSNLGQAWISSNIDKYVIDCDEDGYSLGDNLISISASLFFGNNQCTLNTSIGRCVFSGLGSAITPSFSQQNTVASHDYEIEEGAYIASETLSITLEGTYNGTTYKTTKSVSIVANRQGASGQPGEPGQPGQPGSDGSGAVFVETNEEYFVIYCDSDGNASSTTNLPLRASLKIGTDSAVLDDEASYFKMGTTNYNVAVLANTIAVRSFSVQQGSAPGSKITVHLVGSLGGKTYTAEKNVYLLAVKEGAQGDTGNGIASVTTYYLLTTKFEGVTVSDFGAQTEYVAPTYDFPYLWRYTRYVYTNGNIQNSDPELVYVYSDLSNPNLLASTDFISGELSGWDRMGYAPAAEHTYQFSVVQNYLDGHNAYHAYGDGIDDGEITMLSQTVYGHDSEKRIEGGKWYTLSFWVVGEIHGDSFVRVYLPAIDTTSGVKMYVNGVERQSANGILFENIGTTPKRLSVTFKTISELSSNTDYACVWDLTMENSSNEIYVCMPKLEIGKVVTPYVAMKPVTTPLGRTSVWEAGKQYYQGASGEPFLDIVSMNGKWYKCLRSHISTNSRPPVAGTTTVYWQPADDFSFIATDLLLADQAVINLFFGNTIYMRNDRNQLTASINEGGTGNYAIYYPSSGRKMMEFCSDGYIRYYNDNDGNTVEWKLGLGGSIVGHDTADWEPIMLYKLASQSVNFTTDQVFNRSTYFQFHDGDLHNYTAYDGAIYGSHVNNDPTDSVNAPVATGWYTPTYKPWHKISDDGETMFYVIEIYKIVSSSVSSGTGTISRSKITQTWLRLYNTSTGEYTNEQIS